MGGPDPEQDEVAGQSEWACVASGGFQAEYEDGEPAQKSGLSGVSLTRCLFQAFHRTESLDFGIVIEGEIVWYVTFR